jgi:hypothetical protein
MSDDYDVVKRMQEMMEPVDKCIQMTDDDRDLLALACAMLQRTKEIFDNQIGVPGRKEMFKDLIK